MKNHKEKWRGQGEHVDQTCNLIKKQVLGFWLKLSEVTFFFVSLSFSTSFVSFLLQLEISYLLKTVLFLGILFIFIFSLFSWSFLSLFFKICFLSILTLFCWIISSVFGYSVLIIQFIILYLFLQVFHLLLFLFCFPLQSVLSSSCCQSSFFVFFVLLVIFASKVFIFSSFFLLLPSDVHNFSITWNYLCLAAVIFFYF